MTALMVDTGTTPPVEREKRQKRERFGTWRRLPPKAKVGVALLGFFVLIAIIGPTLAPYDPSYQNPSPNLSLNAPSLTHLLGTTQNGQDVFSQLLTGVRMTLELAIIVGLVATAIGVIIGISAGFLGGMWDEVLSLVSNVFLVLPILPLLVVLLGYLPQRGESATILVLALVQLAVGGAGNPGADPCAAAPRLCGRVAGDGRAWLAHHHIRDHAQRDQPDRGQFCWHRALRHRRLGCFSLYWPG